MDQENEDAGLVRAINDAVRRVTGPGDIELHRPFADVADAEHVHQVAARDPVGYGAIREFEDELARQCGVQYAIGVTSGTAALHLALLALGAGPGRRVSVPPLSFIAPANAVTYTGAELVIGNPDSDDYIRDIEVVVDLLGMPDPELLDPRRQHADRRLIEDAAEALGSSHGGRPCGSFGKIGILSFNNNKIVTTGGGGAVLTDDLQIAEAVHHLATTAKAPHAFFFQHDKVGFNYRMNNLAAAFGLGQLLRLPSILRRKRELHERYVREFNKVDEVGVFSPSYSASRPNHWLNAIMVPRDLRDRAMTVMNKSGIGCRALFTPLHMQAPYRNALQDEHEADMAKKIWQDVICLPSGNMENRK